MLRIWNKPSIMALVLIGLVSIASSFTFPIPNLSPFVIHSRTETASCNSFPLLLSSEDSQEKSSDEVIAAKIKVSGDVHGGYYRACVMNEAGKFRRLVGRMTDPDDSKKAEIYVEGKRKMVEGFIRWCKLADKKIAMNQKIVVEEVSYDEEPTGLYEGFYCKTK